MSNKTLTAQTIFKYTDEDGVVQSKSTTVTVPYGTADEGELQVIAGTADETDFVIPFGGIASATALYLRNNTDADMELTLNAGADFMQLAPGAELHIAQPVKPLAVPLSSAKLTTAGVATLGGKVAFKVFGDPV